MNLDGILPPIATTFLDEALDLHGVRTNVQRWLQTEIRGLVVLGSNGEAAHVSDDEAVRLIAAVRADVPRDRLVIAGVGRSSTRLTIAAARAAAHEGVDAVLVLTPSAFKTQMTGDALARYYTAVADASPVPVLLYNFASATGVSLPLATAVALSAHPNIIAMKESGGDIGLIADLVTQTSSDFPIVVGSAPTLYASLCVGVTGAIVAVANVVPDLCVRLHHLVRAGRHAEALSLQRALTPLARAVTQTYGVAGLKAAMDLAGYVGGLPRAPLVAIPPAVTAELRGHLDRLREWTDREAAAAGRDRGAS